MKLLVVEDDATNLAFYETELKKIPSLEFTLVKSRDTAFELISKEVFDLIVLDLKIPTADAEIDADRNHGLSVHGRILTEAPGTPTVVCSGYGDIGVVRNLGEQRGHGDPWGRDAASALSIFKEKTELNECLACIREAAAEVEALQGIEISSAGANLNLGHSFRRVLRIFARITGGNVIRVRPLGGGLSGARTLSVEVVDAQGSAIAMGVAKLDLIPNLSTERARYQQHIVPILGVGAFAHEIRFVDCGAGNFGGLFYGLAKTYPESGLDLLAREPELAAKMVELIQAHEKNWIDNAVTEKKPISQIREALISSEKMNEVGRKLPFNWQEFEATDVTVRTCSQHRDMHVLNVLATLEGVPVLIDYGEVGDAPSCLDPLTLELSLLFHPSAKKFRQAWVSADRASKWANCDEYCKDLAICSFVKKCRSWAFEANQSDRGVYATAYAYAVRQLKYPDTDHNLAVAIAAAARNALFNC